MKQAVKNIYILWVLLISLIIHINGREVQYNFFPVQARNFLKILILKGHIMSFSYGVFVGFPFDRAEKGQKFKPAFKWKVCR